MQTTLGAYFLSCLLSDLESLKTYAGIHLETQSKLDYIHLKCFADMIYWRLIGDVCDVCDVVAILSTKRKPLRVKC